MSKDKTFETKFRRRQQGKTDYVKRLAYVRSKKVRIVVRKTSTQIIAHAVKYNPVGDETLAAVTSKDLTKYGFYGTNNTPSAYLVGYLLGKKLNGKVEEAMSDIGRRNPSHGGVVFACLQGVVDSGINLPLSNKAVPSEDRISGKILDNYAKDNADKFSQYTKAGITPGEIEKAFEKAKSEIEKVKANE
ncbi:MAG: 50S ribosomal protein L18 [Candidatus Diapherotrites archaeon]|jgi:large subunit ribosomal protein L18|uniref:Large ribosomal subunit protein uL18 n=1 Tax=Candidatus Iainarchaeum sp. TaxID=3101447 RepID=A0A8T5GF68_9ARCH|nr:50S ribosomal protein L18 [Candidatus Diapherotrites archaeon]